MVKLGLRPTATLLALLGCGSSDSSPTPTASATPVATAIGTVKGDIVSATVGPAGGGLRSADARLEVTIPAGALSADTVISLQALQNLAHGRLGDGYRLLPEGTTFASPVALTFHYTDAEARTAGTLGVAFQRPDQLWQWVADPVVDAANKTVTVSTTHFSDWSLVEGLQLRPPSASVPTGGAVQLTATMCYLPQRDDDLVALGYDCSSDLVLPPLNAPKVEAWTVNGISNGNNKVGRISGSGNTVTYMAPDSAPAANPVAVAMSVTWMKKATQLVSNITVGDGRPYAGRLSFTQTGKTESITGTANLTWTFVKDRGSAKEYAPSGNLDATFSFTNCLPLEKSFVVDASAARGINLQIFDPGVPMYGSTYFFQLALGSEENVVCNGVASKRTVSVALSTQGCTATGQMGVPWSTTDKLADSFHCDDSVMTTDMSWSFTLQ